MSCKIIFALGNLFNITSEQAKIKRIKFEKVFNFFYVFRFLFFYKIKEISRVAYHLCNDNRKEGMIDVTSLFFNIFALLVDCGLIFGNVYFLAVFSDLEADQVNPIDMCRTLNVYFLPEIIVHTVHSLLFLVTGRWILFLINTPLIAWHAYR